MEYEEASVLARLRERKRLVLYLLSFVVVVAIESVLYWWGMNAVEGDPRSMLDSIGIVVQSLTTTGYGQDAPWNTAFLSLLVIAMQFTGVVYLFIAFPLFVVPWLRETVGGTRLPRAVGDIEDHIVLGNDSPLYSTLFDDIEAADGQYVVLENDEERARELYEQDRNVVLGDLGDRESYFDINLHRARACVVDASEDRGIEAVLELREFDPDLDVVCLVDEPGRSEYLRYAGATCVLSPKHRLGKALADKARNVVTVDLDESDEVDVDEYVREFHVTESSTIVGRTLGRLDELEETGATLVGAWIDGQFVTTFSPTHHVDQNTVLVVAGSTRQQERVGRITQSEGNVPPQGPVAIAGNGLVATTARGILRKADCRTTVIGRESEDGVDVVGDPTEPETYREAGLDEAGTVLLALEDDRAAILATLVVRQYDEDVEILVAVEDGGNETKLYNAGANYVLALPRISGRMVMHELFEEDVLALPEQVRLTTVRAPGLAGRQLSDDAIRSETGAAIVGLRHDGKVRTEFHDGFELTGDEELLVAGPDSAIEEFESKYAN